jgi:class III poly(R)-hydroxyalkanoic acid synthase PhaC subunit
MQKLNEKYQEFMDTLLQIENSEPTWSTPNEVILEHEILRLRHFPNPHSDCENLQKRPVFILPPQAGHHSNLADYSPEQSLVRVFHNYGFNVFVAEWLSAEFAQRHLGMSDVISLTDEAVDKIRNITGMDKIHLVGECQGGWQAAIYTSLYQDKIHSLVAAAAPIDLAAAPSEIVEYAQLPMPFFEYLVAIGNGLMDGKYMLMGFKNMQPEQHYVRKYFNLWNMIDTNDQEGLARFKQFEKWYAHTQKLPGKFYLEIIKDIFKENNLTKPGSFSVNGKAVDLRNITCPITILAGKKDHITPPPQAFALKKYVSTPPENIVEILTEGGHIGTLMGRAALRDNWTTVNEILKKLN